LKPQKAKRSQQSHMQTREKVLVITGATSGIGREATLALAPHFQRLFVLARDAGKGEELAAQLKIRAPGCKCTIVAADLRSLLAVREAARCIAAHCDHVDVLINNAGLICGERRETKDGYEETFGVNHLAAFALTQHLISQLKRAGRPGQPARVITVASDAHRRGKIDFDDLMSTRSYRPYRVYCASKLANILFTKELARRVHREHVIANCLHPGVVATGFGRREKGVMGWLLRFGRIFLRTPAKGAETIVFLAVAPEVSALNGRYFENKALSQPSSEATRDDHAKRLWHLSCELANVDEIDQEQA
jgi:NAD(P)-dependent dehydrogenase (short-subunit alcohol dehydrogenase family)